MTAVAAFHETQGLSPLNRALLIAVGLVTVAAVPGPIGYGIYRQLLLGVPWGTKPAPTPVLLATAAVAVLASLLPFLLLSLEMTVEVAADEIVVSLKASLPLRLMRPRRIPREEIVDAARASRFPLGAGASRGWRSEAYRVSGREGVELTLRSGKTVFIGSGRPRDLLAAVEALRAA